MSHFHIVLKPLQTDDEFALYQRGTILRNESSGSTYLALANVQLPNEVDWRKKGCVTEVRNQVCCKTCHNRLYKELHMLCCVMWLRVVSERLTFKRKGLVVEYIRTSLSISLSLPLFLHLSLPLSSLSLPLSFPLFLHLSLLDQTLENINSPWLK